MTTSVVMMAAVRMSLSSCLSGSFCFFVMVLKTGGLIPAC